MSWHLFDERGERAQKLVLWAHDNSTTRGWITDPIVTEVYWGKNVLGFKPERSWRPTYFVAKMSQGYRIFEIDVGEVEYAEADKITDWWEAASRDHKRLPTMAAVEMYLRHTCG